MGDAPKIRLLPHLSFPRCFTRNCSRPGWVHPVFRAQRVRGRESPGQAGGSLAQMLLISCFKSLLTRLTQEFPFSLFQHHLCKVGQGEREWPTQKPPGLRLPLALAGG